MVLEGASMPGVGQMQDKQVKGELLEIEGQSPHHAKSYLIKLLVLGVVHVE